jgi:hypothetical protein
MIIVQCNFCPNTFEAKRSDAKRCINCRARYKKEFQQSEHGKLLRAVAHRKLREEAFAGYGGKCGCCGEKRFEFLAIDHVNGGGREERLKLSTYQIARKVINLGFPPEYRVLCHNCNQSLGWYGFCPHQAERTA